MVPNDLGDLVAHELRQTETLRENVRLDTCVVMPNHVHVVFWITDVGSDTARRVPTTEEFGKPAAGSLSTAIRAFKSAVTRKANVLGHVHEGSVWQKGFFEKCIRGDKQLDALRRYIRENPLRWSIDPENCLRA